MLKKNSRKNNQQQKYDLSEIQLAIQLRCCNGLRFETALPSCTYRFPMVFGNTLKSIYRHTPTPSSPRKKRSLRRAWICTWKLWDLESIWYIFFKSCSTLQSCLAFMIYGTSSILTEHRIKMNYSTNPSPKSSKNLSVKISASAASLLTNDPHHNNKWRKRQKRTL